MKSISPATCTIIIMLLFPGCLFSQNKATYLGVNITAEAISGNTLKPGAGLVAEHRFTKHSGIESGVYFRSLNRSLFIMNGSVFINFKVSEKYLSIPLLYKFYSNIANISLGPTFDYYIAWSQKNGNSTVNSYTVDPKLYYGVLVKLSKSIKLNRRIYLEPELRLNPIINADRSFLGAGIATKIQL
ncbi:MAG: hypothetical protein ABJB11_20065 [Ferruginibacter sp.]